VAVWAALAYSLCFASKGMYGFSSAAAFTSFSGA